MPSRLASESDSRLVFGPSVEVRDSGAPFLVYYLPPAMLGFTGPPPSRLPKVRKLVTDPVCKRRKQQSHPRYWRPDLLGRHLVTEHQCTTPCRTRAPAHEARVRGTSWHPTTAAAAAAAAPKRQRPWTRPPRSLATRSAPGGRTARFGRAARNARRGRSRCVELSLALACGQSPRERII